MVSALVLLLVLTVTGYLLRQNHLRRMRQDCVEHLSRIAKYCAMWPTESDESFPNSLEDIAKRYPDDPLVPHLQHFTYISGLDASFPSERVLAYCATNAHGRHGGAILFVDGKAQWYSESDFEDIIRKGRRP